MRAVGSLLAFVFAVLISAGASQAAEVVNNPDFSTVFFLQHKFAHTVPSYEATAQWDDTVRSADEFRKPAAIAQAVARLKARAASLDGVKRIVVNLMTTFADYDARYQEYDFNINDGTYIDYNNGLGGDVRIALTNGTKAQTWKLNPAEAEEILRKNKGFRSVTLVLSLVLLPSPPAVGGELAILNAKIVGYDILAEQSHAKLGSVVVERGL